jgi:hypothetical protein
MFMRRHINPTIMPRNSGILPSRRWRWPRRFATDVETMRVPSLPERRMGLVVVGILAMLFGLGLAGAGMLHPNPRPERAAETPFLPAGTVLAGSTASPRVVGDRSRSDSTCLLGPLIVSPLETGAQAPISNDRGEYLRRMAALLSRRRAAYATSPDPYQASLHPAVYLAAKATPVLPEERPGGGPHGLQCRSGQ